MSGARPRHIVDFHTHAFPEKVAARAAATLSEAYEVELVAQPTIAGLLGMMDECGVEVSVVAPVATRADQVRSINDWAASANSNRIAAFGALHPQLNDLAGEVERMLALGLLGVKLQPNFQQFSPDDERMWPAYEAAEGRLVVLFHSGQEIRAVDRIHASPAAVARVHERFPRLVLVVAHMGGYQMWPEVRRELVGRALYFDSSYCHEGELGDEELAEMVRAHGANRVVFGTDFPWAHPGRDVARLLRIGLEQWELEAIAWENARDLLGLDLT